MKFDFDTVYDRRNTESLKYDFAAERGRPQNVLPLWVADMDFKAPPVVLKALENRVNHGIFGYSEPKEGYYNALENWFLTRHSWHTQGDKFVLTCGVVHALSTLVRAVTAPNDAVIICQPVYYPFSECVIDNGRKLVVSKLKNVNGFYTVDFADFEKKIVENGVKMFILCNPHNPVGRVWTREELAKMGGICLNHGVFVVSDEIHSDFVFEGKHTVFPTVDKSFEDMCAVCTAPTKTFNLAGLHIANTYIYNDNVRENFRAELNGQGYSQPNVMGITACRAAYEGGAEWLDELRKYLAENIAFAKAYIDRNLPKVGFLPPQGTYLIWLDFNKYGLSDEQLQELITKKAGLWLDDGYIFGAGGNGFQRMNVACPRSVLKTALERLKLAIDTVSK